LIATVTLNPAMDKIIYLSKLDRALVNRATKLTALPGGKGINVALMLNRLGHEVMALGLLGGFLGEFIEASLEREGVFIAFQHVAEQSRSNFIVVDDSGEITQVLEPGPLVSEAEIDRFLSSYDRTISECDMVVIGGTCPPGCPPDIYKELILRAKNKGLRTVLNAYGEPFERGVEAAPDIVKPDTRFIRELLGQDRSTPAGRRNISEELLGIGVKTVIIAHGRLNHQVQSVDDIFDLKVSSEVIVNTVTSGDAFLAGLIDGFERDLGLREASRWAAAMEMAAGTDLEKRWASVTDIELRLGHVDQEEIDEG